MFRQIQYVCICAGIPTTRIIVKPLIFMTCSCWWNRSPLASVLRAELALSLLLSAPYWLQRLRNLQLFEWMFFHFNMCRDTQASRALLNIHSLLLRKMKICTCIEDILQLWICTTGIWKRHSKQWSLKNTFIISIKIIISNFSVRMSCSFSIFPIQSNFMCVSMENKHFQVIPNFGVCPCWSRCP